MAQKNFSSVNSPPAGIATQRPPSAHIKLLSTLRTLMLFHLKEPKHQKFIPLQLTRSNSPTVILFSWQPPQLQLQLIITQPL